MADRLRHRLAAPWLRGWRLARRWAPAPAGGPFRVLLLHGVAEADSAAFARLAAYVRDEHGVLSPDGAEAALRDGAPAAREGRVPCLLTFDDGFRSNLEAGRTLARLEIRALFFVCPGLVDLPEDSRRAETVRRVLLGRAPERAADAELMSWEDLRELASLGHAIGSHGLTHRALPGLDDRSLAEEVDGAARLLRERLGREAGWFAYPFGGAAHVDARALAAVRRRHRFCRSGVRGLNRRGTDAYAVLADAVDLSAPFEYQQLVLEGGLDWLYRGPRAALRRAGAASVEAAG